jgi:hypothetical protein
MMIGGGMMQKDSRGPVAIHQIGLIAQNGGFCWKQSYGVAYQIPM